MTGGVAPQGEAPGLVGGRDLRCEVVRLRLARRVFGGGLGLAFRFGLAPGILFGYALRFG